MLTLTRELNQKILIGDNIKLVVLGIKGNQVSIGVEAPKDVAIVRNEAKKRRRPELDHST